MLTKNNNLPAKEDITTRGGGVEGEIRKRRTIKQMTLMYRQTNDREDEDEGEKVNNKEKTTESNFGLTVDR